MTHLLTEVAQGTVEAMHLVNTTGQITSFRAAGCQQIK